MEGLLVQAVRGAAQVVERGDFALPQKVHRTTRKFQRSIDSVRSWINDECEIGAPYELHKGTSYLLYKQYCDDNGYGRLGRNKFYERMLTIDGIRDGRAEGTYDGQRVFSGIRQTPLDEPMTTDTLALIGNA